jgi:hypothetical protein
MANDRLYLKCRCGETFMLAKFWGGADWAVPHWDIEVQFEEWLNRHAKECMRQWGNSLGREPGFELRTEATADEPHSHPLAEE